MLIFNVEFPSNSDTLRMLFLRSQPPDEEILIMKTRNIISSAGLLAATALGLGSTATAQDTYTGGIGVAVLIENFNLAGANAIGANFAFPGNPYTPVVNSTTDFGFGAGITPIIDIKSNPLVACLLPQLIMVMEPKRYP
jgi:hypothetical protein